MAKYQLEICAADIDSVYAAAKGGADRVELCCDLAEGGLTPSAGLLRQALNVPDIKINVLIRPRPGDFVYSEKEIKVMIDDINFARQSGANGIVIGALTPEGDIDIACCERLIAAANPLSVTFHRAFDQCRNPVEALTQIISLGCSRLLTSGQAATAAEGCAMLSTLIKQSDNRITILAGSGVSPQNAEYIIHNSGVTELHASARAQISTTSPRHSNVSMGANKDADSLLFSTSAPIVAQLSEIIHSFNK